MQSGQKRAMLEIILETQAFNNIFFMSISKKKVSLETPALAME